MMFLADEGIDRSIVDGIRSSGFDVFYIIEEARALDDEQFYRLRLKKEGY